MQLVLIIAIGLSVLVSETAQQPSMDSMHCISAGFAICVAFAMPVVTTLTLSILVQGTLRGFDRGRSKHFWRAARLRELAPWLGLVAVAFLLLGSPFVRMLGPGVGGRWLIPLISLGIPLLSAIGALAAWYPMERRMLCATTIRRLDEGAALQPILTRCGFVVARLRMTVLLTLAPIGIPMCIGAMAGEIAERVRPSSGDACMDIATLTSAVLLFALAPLLVGRALGLRVLKPGHLEARLRGLASDAGTALRRIYIWPTGGIVANALVIGVIPGTRAVILTDRLLESLRDDEIDAVVAHELGHIKRNHLLWFILVIIASFTLGGLLVEPCWSLLVETMPRAWIASSEDLIHLGIAFAFGLWIFGFASRRFEQQADAFAVRLLSTRQGNAAATTEAIAAVSGALSRVCDASGAEPSRHSWRHGSIQSRIHAVRCLQGVSLDALRIDRIVAGVKIVSLIFATLGIVDAIGVP